MPYRRGMCWDVGTLAALGSKARSKFESWRYRAIDQTGITH
jgi:hypothetical protein